MLPSKWASNGGNRVIVLPISTIWNFGVPIQVGPWKGEACQVNSLLMPQWKTLFDFEALTTQPIKFLGAKKKCNFYLWFFIRLWCRHCLTEFQKVWKKLKQGLYSSMYVVVAFSISNYYRQQYIIFRVSRQKNNRQLVVWIRKCSAWNHWPEHQ